MSLLLLFNPSAPAVVQTSSLDGSVRVDPRLTGTGTTGPRLTGSVTTQPG